MADYQVAKLSVNTWREDGEPVYDFVLYYANWAELVIRMAERFQYANEIFSGLGAHVIARNGEVIGNVLDFGYIETPIRSVTRRRFVEAATELAEA